MLLIWNFVTIIKKLYDTLFDIKVITFKVITLTIREIMLNYSTNGVKI